ncbi:RNA-binding protein Lupus La [Macleaya cordata]|uniref:RNA-binding protein Lupus La n=1 Tax=Macleaya cordata TaxID=56857 RepID=A0A200Q024_MACCD|nr:RNA-binding protein Lupus La [Macleaya cordata]
MSSCLDDSAMDAQGDISDIAKGNVVRNKQPAWNKPLNDVVVEVGPVMGADSWPALSESARASPKSSSDSLKALSDGSVSSVPQGSVIASSQKEQVASNTNPSSSPNHAFSNRQKSAKRVEMPQNNSGNPGQPVIPNASPRGPHQKSNNWEGGPRGRFMTQPRAVNHNHPHQPNWNRRNNSGGRRDQDRPNFEWNSHHRSFKGRDVEMQQPRVVSRNFVGPPPLTTAPFISSPAAVRPFGNPMGPPGYYIPVPQPLEPIRGVPFVNPPLFGGMYVPHPDPQLRTRVVKQIEYYFSSENLCKDIYLRQNMDEQGWVSVSLIAGFNRVKQWTNNIPFILDALRFSTIVEIQGDKIRRKNDWKNWLLRPSNQSVPMLGTQSSGISNSDMLASRIKNVGLEEGKTANNNIASHIETQTDTVLSRSSSENLNKQLQTSDVEG